ncbi:MAG: DUF5107 domain-containing protein [Terriglobia bacterium]
MTRRWFESLTGTAVLLLLAVPCARAAAVQAWRGTITIPTYLLGPADPNPPFPLLHNKGPVYPYTMVDDLTNHRVPKTYRAIYLENKYLKVTILPDLGGHVYSIYDKIDHREVLYCNHVVKYGLIGPRGAWISGGIEFSFPFAHTDVSVSPVESRLIHNPDGSATATVGAVDWVSNMHWEVALTLRPDTARLEGRVTLFNSTPLPHLYLFWANAAVKATDDMQYIYPMRETISDDPFAVIASWPVWHGVNRSWYKSDPSALAIFARSSHRNYFGVCYHQSNYGVVHVANFRQDPGKKVWTWGTAPSGLIWAKILSDNDGPYCEIQSGRFLTQGYRELMDPRRVETWAEYWYPVRGLDGGFVQATNQMAVNVVYSNQGGVKLIVSPVAAVADATVMVKLGAKLLRTIPHVHLTPLSPSTFTIPVQSLEEARKELTVEVRSHEGKMILRWSAAEPVDGNPDFVPAAGTHVHRITYTPKTPLEEVYLHGLFLEKKGDLEGALKVYDEVLKRDPGYVPALLKEATHAYLSVNFQKAESLVARALARDGEDPSVHYLAGVVYRGAGRVMLAQDAFWACIHYGGPLAPALTELGEISIQQKNYAKAARLLERATRYNPRDALALTDLAVAMRLAGDASNAQKISSEAVSEMPLLPYALAEQWLGVRASGAKAASVENWTRTIGVDPQNYIAVGAWYHNLRAFASSEAVLQLAAENLQGRELSPMVYYYLASNARAEGKIAQAESDAQKAASLPCDEVFPNRVSDAVVLAEVLAHHPADTHAQYALGNFLFAHGRYSEAASLWFKALGEGFESAVLLRNLGVYAWQVKKDLPSAAGFYARAIRLNPADYRLYTDLDEIYAQTGNASARAKLFESAPPEVLQQDTVRARYVLYLIEQSKFDGALAELSSHQFKPWEGGQEIHNMFVVANVEKGSASLRDHRPQEAERAFREAMQYPENLGVGKPAQPQDEQQLYDLGSALEAQGKTTQAQAAWKRAAEAGRSASGISAIYSALALEKLGQSEAAQQILERCIETSRQPRAESYNYFVAGMAERYRQNSENARSDFRRALDLDPRFWQARLALREMNRQGS